MEHQEISVVDFYHLVTVCRLYYFSTLVYATVGL